MDTLVTKASGYVGFTNELTTELDNLLTDKEKKFLSYGQNCIINLPYNLGGSLIGYPIRYPGATRGHIAVNREHIIQSVSIYSDSTDDIYVPNVREYLNKYIGAKLIFE